MSKQQKTSLESIQNIKPLFEDKNFSLWWEYKTYSEESMDDIKTFFNTHMNSLSPHFTKNIFENSKLCSQAIGAHCHPALEMPSYFLPQSDANEQEMADSELTSKEVNFLIINNFQVDYLTAYILQQVWPFCTVSLFKLSYNSFSDPTLALLTNIVTNPNNKITRLFFEWNKLENEQQLASIAQFGKSENLEMLILRSNCLTEECIESLVNNLKENNNIQLKFFDLYDNNLSAISLSHLATFLEKNRTLESLGLSKNNITDLNQLSPLLMNIGKFPLSEEELEAYRNKEKEKEAIIARNSKLKNKTQVEPVPLLDPIVQNNDQSYSIMKNMKMQMINLSVNKLGDENKEALDKFMNQSHEKFQVILTNNLFSDKFKEKFKKKMNKRVHF